jgi:hypothetical protein
VQELHGQVLARYGRAGTLSTPPTSPYVPARDNMPQSSPHYVPSPPALAGPCQPLSCLCTTGCCSSNESQSSSRFQSSRFGELGAVRPPRAHRSPVLSPTNASLAVSLALSGARGGIGARIPSTRYAPTSTDAPRWQRTPSPVPRARRPQWQRCCAVQPANQLNSDPSVEIASLAPTCLPVSRASSRLCRRRPRIYTCCVATASCTPAWNNEISSRASHLTPGLFHG